MANITLAIAPVFLVILLGFVLRKAALVEAALWSPMERLTYIVTFPALLISNLAGADLAGLPWQRVGLAVALTTLAIAALAWILGRRWGEPPLPGRRLDGPARGALFQAAIRPNTFVGLAAAGGLLGPAGITLTALCVAVVVPMVNVLCVAVLSLTRPGPGGDRRAALRRTLVGIVTNPLILACIVGIALNVSGLGLPPVIGPTLEVIGRAALPLGLMAVGAGLAVAPEEPRPDSALLPALGLSATLKLILSPLIALLLALILGLRGEALVAVAIYGGLPCAASAYILARQMGGNGPLTARLISAQTLLAALSMPLVAGLVLALAG
ncbi:AEC family transporter [Roseospirillum parvum]|uniref:Transporter n=1 Tax=Roseospirillum parvum TaxID=83401 RepID=A0A1G7XVR3_9PROT|nr:AEC family transporter [Roseospirillum parvum]SDG88126.1 hypothetical protein SAMN05421742_103110 [Roseospirillum parvum]